MEKIMVGRTRKKSKAEEISGISGRYAASDAVFVFGAAAVCVMLTLPMLASPAERALPSEETAVMVFSTAVQNAGASGREELTAPSGREMEEEWSFYDYIGELFAGLISGQG